jgi:hypothetical protein
VWSLNPQADIEDIVVCKLDKSGNSMLYSTYIGGNEIDVAWDLDISENDDVYLTGYTASTDFPTTSSAYSSGLNGNYDMFLCVINETGNDLLYSSFIGGSGTDYAYEVTADINGSAYIAGGTTSDDFPVTTGSVDNSYNGGEGDGIVCKLNLAAGTLDFSTYLGGSSYDDIWKMEIDKNGNIYLGGYTISDDLPVSAAVLDSVFDDEDGFVCKLDPSGNDVVYFTYIGGSERDYLRGIKVDNEGNVYVAGQTRSDDYPVTPGAYDSTFNGPRYDTFLSKLNAKGDSLIYSTLLGGARYDVGFFMDIDNNGNAYLSGYTTSLNYPVTSGAYDTTFNGETDLFLTKVNPEGSALLYSTYIGGSTWDKAFTILVAEEDKIYIAGKTDSDDFPVTNGAYNETYNGGIQDVFVMLFEISTVTGIKENSGKINPENFSLYQNYPNPFNSSTKIRFDLKNPGYVTLDIFNILGQKIRTLISKRYSAGSYNVNWDGTDNIGKGVSSGMYIFRMKSGKNILYRKMILIK